MIVRSRAAEIDPTVDRAATDVIAAFDAAEKAGLSLARCYRAGVEAWRAAHPDHRPEYAARKAVAVILAAKVNLRVER
jgi:hypothetical protein